MGRPRENAAIATTPPVAPRGLALENLESRLNLSTVMTLLPGVPLGAGGAVSQEVSTAKRYRIEAWSSGMAGSGQYGKSWTNTKYAEAQQFFNRFKDRLNTPTPVTPTDTTTPTPPTPPPAPPPPPPPPTLPPVTISQVAKGNLTRLQITGTTGNDSIMVTQSAGTLTIVANGQTYTQSGAFSELAIYGMSGNDSITVQSSVAVPSLIYGGLGNNTILANGAAKSFVVTLGGGTDLVTGNGVNTSFWADTGDTVNASAAETASGGVHRVAAFYQPFTNNSAAADYVPLALDGQNLRDPTDSGTTVRRSNSFWGTGPTMSDINQGSMGDCYWLSTLQSLAYAQPGKLQEMAVDLGDGTYAVQFKRSGVTTYVRVDGDLPTGGWGGLAYAHPLTTGSAMWAPIMEKAYAFFRSAANTYSSLGLGWTGAAFSDLGVMTTTFNTSSPASVFNQITTALAGNKAVAAITNSTITNGAPIIGSHAYTVVATSIENGIQYLTVRNPWGYDGAGSDANTSDGLVKITLAQFQSCFSAGSIQT